MALFLLITYIVIFTFQIILFVITIRKKTKKLWRILFSAELIPLLISIGLMIYYNNLPGYGFMPGLTYLGEVLFSFGAVVLYCISFLISICSYIAISYKQRKRWINRFCRFSQPSQWRIFERCSKRRNECFALFSFFLILKSHWIMGISRRKTRIYQSFCGDFFSIILMVFIIIQIKKIKSKSKGNE